GAASLPTTAGAFRQPSYDMYVADMIRNATFESENSTVRMRRGHVMFMHSHNVEIENAGFYNLGRTDKQNTASDPTTVDATGVVTHLGENDKGRYSVHFHRTGTDGTSEPARISGSVVEGGPGWGIVNHSSYVIATDNVVYDFADGMVTEAGDEIGRFEHNLIMHIASYSTDNLDAQDYGRAGGNCIFMVGAGVKVIGNIINNMYNWPFGSAVMFYGYAYFRESDDPKQQVMFPAANLDDPSLAKGAA